MRWLSAQSISLVPANCPLLRFLPHQNFMLREILSPLCSSALSLQEKSLWKPRGQWNNTFVKIDKKETLCAPGFSERHHAICVMSGETQGNEIWRSNKFRRGRKLRSKHYLTNVTSPFLTSCRPSLNLAIIL